jgi:hypothetical protein
MLPYRSELAPMSGAIRAITVFLLGIPAAFVGLPLAGVAPSLLLWVGLAIVALYAATWIWWRPTAFEVGPGGLSVVFPGRTRRIPAHDLATARTLTSREFLGEFGLALRIGSGGLWGGFGWLWTRRRGMVELYVSRLDRYLLIERRAGRPLLVTPADPDGLLRALESARG